MQVCSSDTKPFHSVDVQGVPVKFPYKPYGTQMSMMSRIVQSIETSSNCLLESPTGSGKSMALLCASLAWLAREIDRQYTAHQEYDDSFNDASYATSTHTNIGKATSSAACAGDDWDFLDCPPPSSKLCEPVAKAPPPDFGDESDKPPQILFCSRTHKQIAQLCKEFRNTAYNSMHMSVLGSRPHMCVNDHVMDSKTQTVSEGCEEARRYRLCNFHEEVSSVHNHLALRARTSLKGAFDIEELVSALREFGACPYYVSRELSQSANIVFLPYNYLLDPNVRKASSVKIRNSIIIIDEAHNVEDAAREAASKSVTFEELANACDDLKELMESRPDYKNYCQPLLELIQGIMRLMDLTQSRTIRENQQNSSESSSQVWSGDEIVALLRTLNIDAPKLAYFKTCFSDLEEAQQEERDENRNQRGRQKRRRRSFARRSSSKNRSQNEDEEIAMQAMTGVLFRNLFTVLGFIFQENMRYKNDYRIALVQSFEWNRTPEVETSASGVWTDEEQELSGRLESSGSESITTWLSKKRAISSQEKRRGAGGAFRGGKPSYQLTLHFWCLNSGIIFSHISKKARCIVLASGTLSPLISFQGELGVPFPVRLEASHVIRPEQCFVGCLGRGPSGKDLHAVFSSAETYVFQDEVGEMLHSFNLIVPHGILCFVSSFTFLEKLQNRWKNTGLLQRLSSVKHVMFEGRNSQDFETTLRQYSLHIENTKYGLDSSQRNGAILLAVCRGKVSEGLDFADHRARLVVTLGIPFPNVKDPQVILKRRYNDLCRSGVITNAAPGATKGDDSTQLLVSRSDVLSGNQWYEVQAYRALNQALGRCLRHKEDWGALVLVDTRFVQSPDRYLAGISKWVRQKAKIFDSHPELAHKLQAFVKSRLMEEQQVLKPKEELEPAIPLLHQSPLRNSIVIQHQDEPSLQCGSLKQDSPLFSPNSDKTNFRFKHFNKSPCENTKSHID